LWDLHISPFRSLDRNSYHPFGRPPFAWEAVFFHIAGE
jgi:hypothetical protein